MDSICSRRDIAVEEAAESPSLLNKLDFGVDDRPPFPQSLAYALQHVLIMFPSMMVSPIVIGQLLDLSPELRSSLLAAVMFGCGMGTLISSLGVFWVGSRLPLLLGAYTVYVSPVVAIAKTEGLGAATAAMMLGAVFLLIASRFFGRLRAMFPPLVVGTLLIATSLMLLKISTNLAFAVNTPYFGEYAPLGFLLGSVLFLTLLASTTNPFLRSVSVLTTLVAVYCAGIVLGISNLEEVSKAAWFRVPSFAPYGLTWPSVGAVTIVVIYYIISGIYTMSITLALAAFVGFSGSAEKIRGAVSGDAIGSLIAVCFGGVPLISYDQNVGAISLTGVASRFVVAGAGGILVCMAFLPKLAALIGAVPPFMLGGVLMFMCAMIAIVGINIVQSSLKEQRGALIAAAAVGLSVLADFAPAGAFKTLPHAVQLLASDGIVVGTISVVFLNLTLPHSKK
ncbi:MAG: purine/pyrimidine permease [Afipia felis]|nr:purine/pyrimidine permease [Afipia felis]